MAASITLALPGSALVVLVGPSGSGKSYFARRQFAPTEVLSSDACRAMVSDDENNLVATKDAFELLHFMAAKRLARRRLTVVDATNVQASARQPLLELARRYRAPPVAIVFDLPEEVCLQHNCRRGSRTVEAEVVRRQQQQLSRSLGSLEREGFEKIYYLTTPKAVEAVKIERQPPPGPVREKPVASRREKC